VKRIHSALCGLLLALTGSQAPAAQMALVSIDPNNFPATQNIWNSTFGAQIREFSAAPNPNAVPGDLLTAYVATYTKVAYSAPVDPTCRVLDATVPCTADGNALLSFAPFTTPVTDWFTSGVVWGSAFWAQQCLPGTCDPTSGTNLANYPALRIDFTVPTDRVSVDAVFALGMYGMVYAFDHAGNLLATCDPNISPTDPCATPLISGPGNFNGWNRLTITRAMPDVSFILFGGALSDPRLTSKVLFDSPIPLQFGGLLVRAASVGPAAGFLVLLSQVYYEAHDTAASCTLLKGFVSLVNAESGKKISSFTALQLDSTSAALLAGMACH
jgi:hypothetical protein